MSVPASVKTCHVCHKDVSHAPRVKDPQGHYYCATCHEAALKRQHAPHAPIAAAGGAAHGHRTPAVKAVVPPPPHDDNLLDLVPLETQPIPEGRRAPAEEQPKPRPAGKIPEFCPNCGAKTLPNRRLCIKCNRDVTQMEKVIAMKAEEAAGPSREERMAGAISVVMKIGLWVFCIAVVAFVLYGIYLQVKPADTFDSYPKTREQAVRDFLKLINEGTDKSYAKAFLLISFRERTTNASSDTEELRYKESFKKMREDFTTKYGEDWHSKYTLENAGSADNYADDEVDFILKLGEDKYIIATQVQIAVDAASANMIRPSKIKREYAENGKNYFGILDVQGYKVHDRRTMDNRLGITARQKPDD